MKYLVTITEKTHYTVTVEASNELDAYVEAFDDSYRWRCRLEGESHEITATPVKE